MKKIIRDIRDQKSRSHAFSYCIYYVTTLSKKKWKTVDLIDTLGKLLHASS